MKDRLLKHARRHGSDCVLETAAAAGLPLPDLIEIQTELDAIDQATLGWRYRKPRKTAEQRVKAFLGIEENE